MGGLPNKLEQAEVSGSVSAQQDVLAQLEKQAKEWQPDRAQTDMEDLPWGNPSSEVRKPITAQDADRANLAKVEPVNYSVFKNQSAIDQWRSAEAKFAHEINPVPKPTLIAGFSGQTPAGGWPVLKSLPVQVSEDDLKQTLDAQITPGIQALADELEGRPAAIYKWVYDNIDFVPTYGSIQGSQFTLETRRGNSVDTASLLIALLRASGVPARYVYGTIDVPAKSAMNWIGGVQNIDAAQNLLGQGGVPNTALMSGSLPKFLRMEHVWVEANVAVLPGLGSKPANTQTDTTRHWIPLDASFKSYARMEPLDLATAVPFDAQALVDQIEASATINEEEGSIRGVNQAQIKESINAYQAQVESYLSTQQPDADTTDLLGSDEIIAYPSEVLSPVLPYQVNVVVADYAELPSKLRHYLKINLYQDAYERRNAYALGDDPAFSVSIPSVSLQGKPLALSFKPASSADEAALRSYLPAEDSDGQIDLSKLPRSLTSSIYFTPELTLDGELIKSGGSYRFGSEVPMDWNFMSPGYRSSLLKKVINAGEYQALGYNLNGMSQTQLEATSEQLEQTKQLIESQDETALSSLTKHDLTGPVLQAGIQSYFAVNDTQGVIAGAQSNIETLPNMSVGSFGTSIEPNMAYGIALSARLSSSLVMDVDKISYITAHKANQPGAVSEFNLARGPSMSLNENLIPEQLFDDPDTEAKEAEGVSATKILALAMAAGQTIYSITKDNYDQVRAKLNHSSIVMDDIRDGINAGNTVTIHERTLSYAGWSGAGYTILNPNTGSGAYMIGGGSDGGSTFVDLIGQITNWIGLSNSFKEVLVGLAGTQYAFLTTIGMFLFGVSFILNTISIGLNCQSAVFSIAAILVMTFFNVAMIALIATFGLFLAIAAFVALGTLNNLYTKWVNNQLLCRDE